MGGGGWVGSILLDIATISLEQLQASSVIMGVCVWGGVGGEGQRYCLIQFQIKSNQ